MTLLLLHIASCQVFGLCTHVWPPVHSNEDGEGTMPLGRVLIPSGVVV